VVAGRDIPEPHCQHDVYRPVVRPDVSLRPGGVLDPLYRHPVLTRTQVRHRSEGEG
jgi:hypothetical protein